MSDAEKNFRVRFAPSPTGWLHIGNARTALYNWLFARHHGATFVLRIEDTDLERSTADSESGILESLAWMGLDWDEGVERGGSRGPYRQTERLDIYRSYADMLVTRGFAYPCFCTPPLLEEDRQAALAQGVQPRYSGRCSSLSPSEVAARRAGGEPAIRFRVPREEILIDDLVRGRVTFPAGEFGDFVILRSNGVPAYNFAVVVDDHLMEISHVIRGEDHLTNTPKQIFLYRALRFPLPRFAHLSMILGPDQARLSKRHGATSVAQFKEMGYLPEALVNYLALLGWSPGDDREVMDRAEMVAAFSLDRVSKSASIFDPAKLAWMNGVYLRQADPARAWELARPFLEKAGLFADPTYVNEVPRLQDFMELVRGHAHFLSDLPELVRPYLEPRVTFSQEARTWLSESGVADLLRVLAGRIEAVPPLTREDFVSLLKGLGKEIGKKGKGLFMPVRAAMTGEVHGPDLDRVYLLLGPVRVVQRLREAIGAT